MSRLLLLDAGGGGASSLLTGLVAHWRMDEASGNALDVVSALTLTDNNTVTSAAGKIGTARQFTAASTEYFSRASSAALQIAAGDFYIACWVYPDTLTGNDKAVLSKYDDGVAADREYLLRYDVGASRMQWVVREADGSLVVQRADTFGAFSAGAWHFVEVYRTTSPNEIGIAVNGGSFDTEPLGDHIQTTTTPFLIGAIYPSADPWNGRIDSASIWNRKLTAGERAALYNGGAGLDYPF